MRAWYCQDTEPHRELWAWFELLDTQRKEYDLFDAIADAIYLNRPLANGDSSVLRTVTALRENARLNVIGSIVNTLVSRIGKRRPMPAITAENASWDEQRYAEKVSDVVRTKIGHSAIERATPLFLRSALIRGSGVMQVVRDGGDITVEEVPRAEIVIDPRDAKYGDPKTMARYRIVPRAVLEELFEDKEEEVMRAPNAPTSSIDVQGQEDCVEVLEAWRLPCGDDEGRHVIAVRGATLLDEEYTRAVFPFVFMHYQPPAVGSGFWGQGLVEQLSAIQQKVDETFAQIQHNMDAVGGLTIFLPRGANINKTELRAKQVKVVETDGPAPAFVAPNPVSPQLTQYLNFLLEQAYQISGVSQASASSKNPLGSNASGKALDTMYDLESDRFSQLELQYAHARVDLGRLIIDEARAIAADSSMPRRKKAKWINEIDWSRVRVDEGEYTLKVEAVNFLPDTRAGKLSTVKELADSGLLQDPTQTAALFNEPDLARANRSMLGPYNYARALCSKLADPEIPLLDVAPDPHVPGLGSTVKKMVQGEYAQAIAEDAPEEVLERYRQFLGLLAAVDQTSSGAPPSPVGGPPLPPAGGDPLAALQPAAPAAPVPAPGMPGPGLM